MKLTLLSQPSVISEDGCIHPQLGTHSLQAGSPLISNFEYFAKCSFIVVPIKWLPTTLLMLPLSILKIALAVFPGLPMPPDHFLLLVGVFNFLSLF